MAKFDQRGQHVTNQVNADSIGTVNLGSVQNKADLAGELRKLLAEVDKATLAGIIKEKISIDVEAHIKQAVLEIDEPKPKKEIILEHIASAKQLLEGITSAAGLVTALVQASKIAGEFFR
jgi:hypothetical protein